MDYATYIRVKAEMAEHRRFMEQKQFPNEVNGFRDHPNILQRVRAAFGSSPQQAQPATRRATEGVTEQGRSAAAAR